jgi:hypothetical protein
LGEIVVLHLVTPYEGVSVLESGCRVSSSVEIVLDSTVLCL